MKFNLTRNDGKPLNEAEREECDKAWKKCFDKLTRSYKDPNITPEGWHAIQDQLDRKEKALAAKYEFAKKVELENLDQLTDLSKEQGYPIAVYETEEGEWTIQVLVN